MIKSNPTASDFDTIKGKFKSYHNASENTSNLMAKTILAMLDIADISAKKHTKDPIPESPPQEKQPEAVELHQNSNGVLTGLRYNIQIHLPATKDVEVYDAIFRSLKEHLID